MKAATNYIKNVFDSVRTTLIGMRITGRYLLQKPITIQYPDERLPTRDERGNVPDIFARTPELGPKTELIFIDGKSVVETLQNVVDWMEDGAIPRERIRPVLYRDFFADPATQLQKLYDGLEMPLTPDAKRAMLGYIENKPKDKFGSHRYDVSDWGFTREEIREKTRPYIEAYGVEIEEGE